MRRQPRGVGSLLSLCGFQGLNLGSQARQQGPSCANLSCWPAACLLLSSSDAPWAVPIGMGSSQNSMYMRSVLAGVESDFIC